jgi:hypothetical protein
MTPAWSHTHPTYSLQHNGATATISPKSRQFLLHVAYPNGKADYLFDKSVEALQREAERRMKVTTA